jgi:DNA-directed RNA polymerase subunit M/transcription elongation factor TFIIS
MPERPTRLGEVIDDYCPRCRLMLNHDIASLNDGTVAKVTCRTCYNTHDYRGGQLPARRRSTATKPDNQSLMDQVLAGITHQPPAPPAAPVPQRKKRDLWADVERLKKR